MYSVQDVIQTLAHQIVENLQYQDLNILRYAADHL
jgi:hypothetical protein